MRGTTLYLIQGRDVSGAERMHAALIERDADALVCCPGGSRTDEWARELNAQVVPLPFRPLRHSEGILEGIRSVARGLRSVLDLRRVLKAHPARKVVFCTSIRPGMLASLASLGLGRSVFWCFPDFLPSAPLRQAVRLLATINGAGGLSLSEAIREDFSGGSERLRRKAPVVYPGVDTRLFNAAPVESAPGRIAVLGQISYVKRTDLAIDIAMRAAPQVPGFGLRVVGAPQFRAEDFALHDELRERVKGNSILRHAVEWYGFATSVPAALEDCALLLHCRADEPFGIALIEAMATGLPVVAPAGGGPLEIVEHGVTGLLYPPGDADAAATCVTRVLSDRALATRMGRAGRRRVEERFTLDRQLRETLELLERTEVQR